MVGYVEDVSICCLYRLLAFPVWFVSWPPDFRIPVAIIFYLCNISVRPFESAMPTRHLPSIGFKILVIRQKLNIYYRVYSII